MAELLCPTELSVAANERRTGSVSVSQLSYFQSSTAA